MSIRECMLAIDQSTAFIPEEDTISGFLTRFCMHTTGSLGLASSILWCAWIIVLNIVLDCFRNPAPSRRVRTPINEIFRSGSCDNKIHHKFSSDFSDLSHAGAPVVYQTVHFRRTKCQEATKKSISINRSGFHRVSCIPRDRLSLQVTEKRRAGTKLKQPLSAAITAALRLIGRSWLHDWLHGDQSDWRFTPRLNDVSQSKGLTPPPGTTKWVCLFDK